MTQPMTPCPQPSGRPEFVDLVQVVRESVGDYRPALQAAALELFESRPDGPLWVRADPTRVAQVVGNLLHDARKTRGPSSW